MHTLTLVTVDIPKLEDDLQTDQKIMKEKERLKQMKEESESSCLLDIYLGACNNLRDTFSRAVNQAVADAMEPYADETDNPDYLEFCDKTADIEESYNYDRTDCIKLAEGRIVPVFDPRVYERFVINDGKVFECDAGPVKHNKRTKRAKRMTALPGCPIKKLYKDIAAYAEDYYGCSYHQDQGAFGYYFNPNAFYDWYSIGGRWPELFLVKNSCTECSIGERIESSLDTEDDTPKGYKWVCAARKKDIEWQVMLDWRLQKAQEHKRSESNKSCLQHMGIEANIYYPILGCDILNYHEFETMESYIDSLSGDTVLVGVDCHM